MNEWMNEHDNKSDGAFFSWLLAHLVFLMTMVGHMGQMTDWLDINPSGENVHSYIQWVDKEKLESIKSERKPINYSSFTSAMRFIHGQ